MSNPTKFPRWIELADGNKLIVPNHQTMSSLLGEEYDENAELVVKQSAPAPVADNPDSEEFIESTAAVMEMHAEEAAAPMEPLHTPEALAEADPAGIFSGPEPEDLVDAPEVTPTPARKRGKAGKE